jgi:predicted nuclease of predicted toxin-antitoxin system
MRLGPLLQILRLTCGNLTNRRLRTLLDEVLADALTLLATGFAVVEVGDR